MRLSKKSVKKMISTMLYSACCIAFAPQSYADAGNCAVNGNLCTKTGAKCLTGSNEAGICKTTSFRGCNCITQKKSMDPGNVQYRATPDKAAVAEINKTDSLQIESQPGNERLR